MSLGAAVAAAPGAQGWEGGSDLGAILSQPSRRGLRSDRSVDIE